MNSWESVKELQALCGRLDFKHIYAERKLIFFSKLSTSNNIVVQACYNNFRRSRECCVLCCEFDVAIGTCMWVLLKIEWLIVFTVLLLLANRIC